MIQQKTKDLIIEYYGHRNWDPATCGATFEEQFEAAEQGLAEGGYKSENELIKLLININKEYR